MKASTMQLIINELLWFLGIFVVAVIAEYAIFEIFDINPILSVKVQGLLGLLFIGYVLSAAYRIWKSFYQENRSSD